MNPSYSNLNSTLTKMYPMDLATIWVLVVVVVDVSAALLLALTMTVSSYLTVTIMMMMMMMMMAKSNRVFLSSSKKSFSRVFQYQVGPLTHSMNQHHVWVDLVINLPLPKSTDR